MSRKMPLKREGYFSFSIDQKRLLANNNLKHGTMLHCIGYNANTIYQVIILEYISSNYIYQIYQVIYTIIEPYHFHLVFIEQQQHPTGFSLFIFPDFLTIFILPLLFLSCYHFHLVLITNQMKIVIMIRFLP